MKRQLLTAIAALVLMSSSSALATQSYSPFSNPKLRAVLAPVHTVMSALQTRNAQSVKDLYTNDAVVIDDTGSLRWNGAAAGTDWLSNVTGQWAKYRYAKLTDIQLADISMSKEDAYVVVYGTIASTSPDHPFRSQGSFTFTLSKASGSWKITSQTFSPLYGLGPYPR